MDNALNFLERVARSASLFATASVPEEAVALTEHPFAARDVHDNFPTKVRRLFDNGHYAEATLEAFKYVDTELQRLSGLSKTGEGLMMEAFKEDKPIVRLTPTVTMSEKDEQRGYKFLFAGASVGIRNPRAHDHSKEDDLETCLGHLSFATHLMRRLERAGYVLQKAP